MRVSESIIWEKLTLFSSCICGKDSVNYECYVNMAVFFLFGKSRKETNMNKKSHISLAAYLINCEGFEGLQKHKRFFYLGSILPDCVPSFLTRKHRIDTTYEILRKEITKLAEKYHPEKGFSRSYCRRLGVVTHYLADYVTYPHNHIFKGSLAEHCAYEFKLFHGLQEYLSSPMAKRVREQNGIFRTVDEICEAIRKMHEEYLRVRQNLIDDCHFIVELCYRMVDAILQLFELRMPQICTTV